MKFVLYYRGSLRANGKPEHKHDLRRVFHAQLARLWAQPPLNAFQKALAPPARPEDYSVHRALGPFAFAPLVTEQVSLVAELDLNLLRPEPPGRLLTQGGDIDNRLKTLFDALTMPRHENALPSGAKPLTDETPFFCLLEDDNLVTSVAVRTNQLLDPNVDDSTIVLIIGVNILRTRNTWGNGVFG